MNVCSRSLKWAAIKSKHSFCRAETAAQRALPLTEGQNHRWNSDGSKHIVHSILFSVDGPTSTGFPTWNDFPETPVLLLGAVCCLGGFILLAQLVWQVPPRLIASKRRGARRSSQTVQTQTKRHVLKCRQSSRNSFYWRIHIIKIEQRDWNGEQMGGCSSVAQELCEHAGLCPPPLSAFFFFSFLGLVWFSFDASG